MELDSLYYLVSFWKNRWVRKFFVNPEQHTMKQKTKLFSKQ